MKIAICLSGHMRKFEETFPTLYFYFLKNYDCDIFIHTWNTIGYGCAFKTDHNYHLSAEIKLPEINRLYKPKKIIIENVDFIEELKSQGDQYAPHLKNCPKHVGHMASMFYKIYAANELRKKYEVESGVKYDWVVRCRPDLIFHRTVELPKIQTTGKVYLARGQCNPGWYSDQFAIALPNDMDLYSSFFFHMPEYFQARNEFYPEKFMDWSLRKKNLIPEMLDLHFNILR